MAAQVVRVVTFQLVFDEGKETLGQFETYTPADVAQWGDVVYDMLELGAPDALPEEDSTGSP